MMGCFFFACIGFSVKTWYLDSVLVCSGTFISFSGCESHTLVAPMYSNYFGWEGANFLPEMGFSYHHSPGLTGRNSLHLFNFYLYTQTHPYSIWWNYCTFIVFIFVPGCWTITLLGSCLRRLSLGSNLWNICESNRFKHGKCCLILDMFIKTMFLYFRIW